LTHKLQAEIGTKIGLGWHFYKKNIRWHNGGTGGYRSFCGIDLEKNRGVVILANSTYSVDDLGLHLLDDSKEILNPKAIAKVNSKIYKDYVGKYIVGGIMAMNVTTKNGKLYFQLFGQPAYRIYPESKTLYFMLGLDVEFEFVRDENGEVNSIIFEQNSYKQMAKRVKE
jgi:D-alanyl-D-alanine-carboxypeptidase/D-alanyl-D-alanine-endopeptidase